MLCIHRSMTWYTIVICETLYSISNISLHAYKYIHIYIYIYTHTHTHTHTYDAANRDARVHLVRVCIELRMHKCVYAEWDVDTFQRGLAATPRYTWVIYVCIYIHVSFKSLHLHLHNIQVRVYIEGQVEVLTDVSATVSRMLRLCLVWPAFFCAKDDKMERRERRFAHAAPVPGVTGLFLRQR